MIQIDYKARTPIFEQIKNQITELVISGILKPHDQIPSIRGLAKDLKLNFNTVKRAYADLEQARVIYTLSGRGCFIAETAFDNTLLKEKAFNEIVRAVKIGHSNGIPRDLILKAIDDIYNC